MARVEKCSGCNQETSYLFAAQFYNGPSEHLILCGECWTDGVRCYYSPTKGLAVFQNTPLGDYREAKVYYDAFGIVTGEDTPITYPSMEQ